jgi:Tol biopolymer transport system component
MVAHGQLIAYTSWLGTGLNEITPDGIQNRTLATVFGNAQWSPDGSRIALRTGLGEPAQTIVLAHADGSGVRTIATNTAAPIQTSEPVWSPDSQHLAYVGSDATGLHLYLIEADGTATRQITTREDPTHGRTGYPLEPVPRIAGASR